MKENSKFTPYLCKEHIMLALSLDKKKQLEHVIIGPEPDIYAYLLKGGEAQLFYNQKRPIGTLLFEHEAQDEGEWNLHVHSFLADALRPFADRDKAEKAALAFLEMHLDSSDAVCKFVACKSLATYYAYRKGLGNPSSVTSYHEIATNLSRFFKKFILGPKGRSNIEQALKRTERAMSIYTQSSDTQARILFPGKVHHAEWLLISASFYPAIMYYLQRIRDFGLCLCTCSVCGKIYCAESLHHSLCSEACRIAQRRQNKREFDARAKTNGYDHDYKNTSQRMRNRLNRLKEQETVPAEAIQKAEQLFAAFRKEALQRKKKIITKSDRKAFQDWMFAQEQEYEQFFTALGN